MEFVNGKDDIPYMMENKSYVWKQQPYIYIYTYLIHIYTFTYILRIRTLPAKGWEGTDTAPWIIPQYFLRRYVHPKEYIYIYTYMYPYIYQTMKLEYHDSSIRFFRGLENIFPPSQPRHCAKLHSEEK